MFSPEQLVKFNETLLGRGAPIEKDNIGYNKPDYLVCNNYYSVLSDVQLADLSRRLVKYCQTQLDADKQKMIETANYYNAKISNESLERAISIQPGKEMTLISFSYNPEFIAIVKKANKRKYDPKIKKWYVANNEVIHILEQLQKVGADCKKAIEYLQENLVINENEQSTKQEQKVNIINVVELKNGKLQIGFSYNPDIVTAIKSLNERKYNPANKTWTITKEEVNTLINKLQNIPNIDFSQLYNFKVKEVKQEVIELMDYSYLTRKPFNHQLEAAKFLLNRKKAILADEMGGGKTLSSILAANQIEGKKLVICPASLKLNWQKEIKFVSNDQIEVIGGKGWVDTSNNGWTIVNYDILCKHFDNILNNNFKVVIMDECHYIKAITNSGKPGSKRATMALQIADNIEYVFMLTGTPITNKTKDIFNTLKAIKHPLSKKFFTFAQRYCDAKHNGYGWDFNGSSNQEELNEKLQGFMLRRLKNELLDLPEKIRSFIPVSINLKAYNKKLDEYMQERENLNNQGEHLVYLNAMRHILAKEKVTATIEQIKNLLDQDQQVVVFTCYNFVVDKLMQEFKEVAVKLTGDCNQKQRQEAVDQFQNGNKKVIVCNIIAAGVGITLTASNIVIFNDFDWVPANHAQAEDRIHRIGQNKKCNIYYMYAAKTFDENAANILENKLNNISKIVDGKEESFITDLINSI